MLTSGRAFPSDPPFGSFDNPIDGTTAMTEIQFSGWALDDVVVASLKIYRDPIAGEGSNQIFIGDALFIEGTRPDVAALYPSYPSNTSAGWGLNYLTYFLPNQGNGTYTFRAIATDGEGNSVTLGSKVILCDTDNNVKPFGSLDSPPAGGEISGSTYLTPQPNTIPTDGSTINIWVDGINLGNSETYNLYREDIATLFPGYNNTDGAIFYYQLNNVIKDSCRNGAEV